MTEWFVAYHLSGGDPSSPDGYNCGGEDVDSELTEDQREALREEAEQRERRRNGLT